MKRCFSLCLGIFFALALTFVFLSTTLETPVSAATSGTTGDCKWSLSGTTLIISGSGAMADYGDYNYDYYSNPPPWWRTEITEVIINNGVTTIGDSAFYNCSSLVSIKIPNSVIMIGDFAFDSCTALASVEIPASVTAIGKLAFNNCISLKEVFITDVKAWCSIKFEDSASNPLYYAGNLYLNRNLVTDLIIPEGVTTIGSWAFGFCTALASVEIPASVTAIDGLAFVNCTSLKEVFITDVKAWCSIKFEDNPLSYGGNLYLNRNLVTDLIIPEGVTTIGDNAFYGCTSLTSVEISEGVTTIGRWAFGSCTTLASVEIPDSVATIGERAFGFCNSLTAITVEEGNTTYHSENNCLIETKKKAVIAGCKNSIVPSDDSVTIIDNFAFLGCTDLESIKIPDNIITIGSFAFSECATLTSVTIGNGVTSIDERAFSECTSLTSVTIGNSVTFIARYAFFRCSSLISIEIPDSVSIIRDYAFERCTSLTSVEIPASVTAIGASAFYNCRSLKEVFITDVKAWCSIKFEDSASNPLCYGGNLYLNGNLVTDLIIPDGVTTIGNYAFFNCASLTAVEIPASVTAIGDGAFGFCSSLASIEFPDSVSIIRDYAFQRCTSLATIEIPASVTAIGDGAFGFCSSLASISIPDSVTSIGRDAFYSCESLSDVWYVGTQENRQNMSIGSDNEDLTSAIWHYVSGNCDTTCNECGAVREAKAHEFGAPKEVDDQLQYNCIHCGYLRNETKELLSPTDSVTASDGKATLQVPDGSEALIHKETKLSVEILSAEENAQIIENVKEGLALIFGEKHRIACTFDVKIFLDNESIQPGGKVKITLELPETTKNYMNLSVVYIDDDGNVTPCESILNPDGTISFFAEHFSNYSLVGEPSYTPGDVDNDGEVTTDDAIYLLFNINFPGSYPVGQPVDFDGNGKTDTDDAIYLLFHVNFPSSYPLH